MFPVSSNILTPQMESWFIVFMGSWDGFRTVYFPTVHKRFYPQTLFTYYIFIGNPLNIYARESLRRQGRLVFLTVKSRKKKLCLRRPRVPYYQSAIFSTIVRPLQLLALLPEPAPEPASRSRDAQKGAQCRGSTFFRSEGPKVCPKRFPAPRPTLPARCTANFQADLWSTSFPGSSLSGIANCSGFCFKTV